MENDNGVEILATDKVSFQSEERKRSKDGNHEEPDLLMPVEALVREQEEALALAERLGELQRKIDELNAAYDRLDQQSLVQSDHLKLKITS